MLHGYLKMKMILETPQQTGKINKDVNGVNLEDEEIKKYFLLLEPNKETHHLGIYNKIAPYFIQLKTGQLAFTDYIKRFGLPIAVAKTMMTDNNYVNRLYQFLENLQNDSFAVFQNNDEIELKESSGKSAEVFEKLIAEHKSNIKKLILGVESVGDESAFVGSTQVSEELANLNSLEDANYVERVVNAQLIPLLKSRGVVGLDNV